MLTSIIEIIDSIAVGKYNTIVAPFVAEDIHQQTVACTARYSLVAVIGAHHLTYITFLYQCLEGGEVGFPKVAHGNNSVVRVAQGFRTAVYGIVLGTGVCLEILIVVALHTENGLYTENSIQVRILTTGLLTTAPSRITEDIHVRTPEGELGVARVVGGTHLHVEHIMVGTVPVGTCLIGNG